MARVLNWNNAKMATYVSVRHGTNVPNRHWNSKFRELRKQKILKISLPDYDAMRRQDALSMRDLRTELKKKGIPPHRPWRERPMHVSSSSVLFEPYSPPEDEKLILLQEKTRQLVDKTKEMWKNNRAQKKIQSYDADFQPSTFVELAKELFVQANEALQNRDEKKLHDLVTEKLFPEMWDELKLKSIQWQLVELLEPIRVVHLRTSSVMQEDNIFAQVTVRMYSKQKLAVFDQFGRLCMGSKHNAKDVVEYIVFENHLSNLYGKWRIHGIIRPKALRNHGVANTIYRKPVDKGLIENGREIVNANDVAIVQEEK